MKYRVLDLFSGCGGLSYGFECAGFHIVAGVDNWEDSLVTYRANHKGSKGILLDLGNFDPASLHKEVGDVDVVIGGPPCQGFSLSGKRNPNDPRNKLYKGFVDVVKEFRPKAFILENVPNLASMAQGKIKDAIIKEFSELGYNVKYKVLLASDYGVPQNRRRVIFVGSIYNDNYEYPTPTNNDDNRVTTSEALSDLPEESVDDGTINTQVPLSDYQKLMRKRTDKIYNHVTSEHSEQTKKIISLVPDGGNYKDLPEKYRSVRNVHIAWTRYNSEKPSLTIDTGHRHHFHYKFNRIPTVRESARLQSFPDDFIFYGSKTSQYKQVGNAVPTLMAKAVAEKLLKHLKENS
ncbi:DNA cytosine methyltransferase [Candidatus Saccharibacteria bacterium]|nr:DNA cytosine methyltransferase [Candidatus Saccharibacteria bacterium]